MKKSGASLLLMLIILTNLSAQEEDREGGKDPALFTRMPNHWIYSYTDNQFDSFDFPVTAGTTQTVEGHYLHLNYYPQDNTPSVSALQVVRNYTNAAKKIGGQIIGDYEDGGNRYAVVKVVSGAKETWASIVANSSDYTVDIIEKQTMEQDVLADASSMARSIKETGKVALYGIYFDTGKSSIKPESQAALKEIARLLKAEADLRLYVVGHTDNTGGFDVNMRLSIDRATSVVNALVSQHSVNAASLKACGDGPTAPVATNDTDKGKALNRRVELVKQ